MLKPKFHLELTDKRAFPVPFGMQRNLGASGTEHQHPAVFQPRSCCLAHGEARCWGPAMGAKHQIIALLLRSNRRSTELLLSAAPCTAPGKHRGVR